MLVSILNVQTLNDNPLPTSKPPLIRPLPLPTMRQIAPAEYLPYVQAFLAHHPNATVFVATDSPSFLSEVQLRWPSGRVRYRTDVLRHEANVAFSAGTSSNFRKGQEASSAYAL